MKPLWHQKTKPSLKDIPSLSEKLESIAHYLAIDKIECKIPDLAGFKIPPPQNKKFKVEDIFAPRANYTKSVLKETIQILSDEIENFTSGNNAYQEIETTLRTLKTRCETLLAENNPFDELHYKGEFLFYVTYKKRIHSIPAYHLVLPVFVNHELRSHLNLRFHFYETLLKKIKNELITHLTTSSEQNSAYIWNSKNPELELSELVSALHYTMKRIKYNKNEGGSFPKFRKAFFGLFGLSDEDYSNKINQIQKRKKEKHFITEMAKQYETFHSNLHRIKKK